MDMSSMSMSMSMPMSTSTGSGMAAAATSAAMSSMDMDMSGGDGCKISMLWNWYTIDSCFLASSWHNRSAADFAGSCIGVVLLVIVLEGLRRAAREYDAYLIRQHIRKSAIMTASPLRSGSGSGSEDLKGDPVVCNSAVTAATAGAPFTPSIVQQAIRALLHMLQFAVAYFIMLLAMYFNGYIIISIFIGAYIGSFIFSWHKLGGGQSGEARDVTYCCG